jgi:hypothetical protein
VTSRAGEVREQRAVVTSAARRDVSIIATEIARIEAGVA